MCDLWNCSLIVGWKYKKLDKNTYTISFSTTNTSTNKILHMTCGMEIGEIKEYMVRLKVQKGKQNYENIK